MDLSWIGEAMSALSLDDLWVWMAALAAAITAMVAVAQVLDASVDAS